MNIHCVSSDEQLQELSSTVSLAVAIEFTNPSSLLDPAARVDYALRPSTNQFSIMNWNEYVNTYQQEPSSTPASFLGKFSPLRLFLDDLIMSMKTQSPVSRQYSYQQFPNQGYYVDTRLHVRQAEE